MLFFSAKNQIAQEGLHSVLANVRSPDVILLIVKSPNAISPNVTSPISSPNTILPNVELHSFAITVFIFWFLLHAHIY